MIVRKAHGSGTTVHMLDDGYDYHALLEKARNGEAESTAPDRVFPGHTVSIVKHDGRTFLVKKEVREYRHLDQRLKRRIYGSPFTAVMHKVAKAVKNGCDRVQKVLLVEETAAWDSKTRTVTLTAWLVLEFLPGLELYKDPDRNKRGPEITAALQDLFRHKLLLLDFNDRNFIVSDGRIRVIDLYFFSSPFYSHLPRAVRKAKECFGIDVPATCMTEKIFRLVADAKLRMLYANRAACKRVRRAITGGPPPRVRS